MKAMRIFTSVLLALALHSSSWAASGDPNEAIDDIETRLQTAWNAHDAAAYGTFFADNADVVGTSGEWSKGRTDFEHRLADQFSSAMANAKIKFEEISIRYPSRDIAVTHIIWAMSGMRDSDASATQRPRRGIQTQVLQRVSHVWVIVGLQDTDAIPAQDRRRD